MFNKLIATLGFLVVFGVTVFLRGQQQQRAMRNLQTQKGGPKRLATAPNVSAKNTGVMNYLLSMAFLVLGFVQFWLLTGIFPLWVVIALVGASLFGLAVHKFIGSVAGFALEQTKVNVLSLIWTAQQRAGACIVLTAAFIMFLTMMIGALYKFWSLPIHSPAAVVWIALFLFALPPLIGTPVRLASLGPLITSEFVDDDVRNSYLSIEFSNIIYATIMLVFPFWLFQRELVETFPWLPPFWLPLSLPLLFFFFGGVIPFFAGMQRYRAKARTLLEWRKKWLTQTSQVLTLEDNSRRQELLNEKIDELQTQIQNRIEENDLLRFYQNVVAADSPDERLLLSPVPPTVPSDSSVTTTQDSTEIVSANLAPDGPLPPREPTNPLLESIYSIIRDNRQNLREWDIRFRDLYKLMHLFRALWGSNTVTVKSFVKENLDEVQEELDSFAKHRNLIAGTLLALGSFVGPILFRAYQNDILALIKKLTGSAV